MRTPTLDPEVEANRTEAHGPFVSAFSRVESPDFQGRFPAWMTPLRKGGISRFAELGLPTSKHEDWRFTNLKPIVELPFAPILSAPRTDVGPDDLRDLPLADLAGDRLVFIDGHFSPQCSRLETSGDGIVVQPLSTAFDEHADLIEQHLARHARSNDAPFVALNEAYFVDGGFIHLPPGRALERPVRLLFISAGGRPGLGVQPRNLIVAGRGSQATVIEQYASLADRAHLTNAVTEIVAGEDARLEHLKLQDECASAFHVARLHTTLARGSNAITHSFALGGKLARYNLTTTLAGENVDCSLNGLYLARGGQLLDHHMVVEHAAPHTDSHEYFNGILTGDSRAVFHGRILVQPRAQKTDAKQSNKNILLSDQARVDSKPQLEIYADDVRCTHGATVGQLDPESIFYLRARGIPLETARRMLIHAFAGEIIDRIRCGPVRERLDRFVWERLEASEQVHVDR